MFPGQARGTGQKSIPTVLGHATPVARERNPTAPPVPTRATRRYADPPIRSATTRSSRSTLRPSPRDRSNIDSHGFRTCNAGSRGSATLPRHPCRHASRADTPIRRPADTFCHYQEFAVDTASSFAFLTVASTSAGAARVGSTKMLVTSVIPMNPKTPPRVLLCKS